MKKQILTDRAEKKYLQELFKCTNVMVWKALTFDSDSDLAKRIRKAAIERGGKLVGVYVPDCETFHKTADGTSIQVFSPRVKLIAYNKKGIVEVLVDNEVRIKRQVSGIPEFMELQQEVQRMASSL